MRILPKVSGPLSRSCRHCLEHVADAEIPRPPNVLIRPFMGEIKGDSQRYTDLLLHRGPTSEPNILDQ